MLMYGRDHHNIVKQLSSNQKKKKKTRAVGICTEQSRRKWTVAVYPPSKCQMLLHFFPTLDISGVGCEQAGAKTGGGRRKKVLR